LLVQQEFLAAHRRTLAIYLRQLANLGADSAPPGVHNGIVEILTAVGDIKARLRAQGETLEDAPGDRRVSDVRLINSGVIGHAVGRPQQCE
jgi:hypothetical protein